MSKFYGVVGTNFDWNSRFKHKLKLELKVSLLFFPSPKISAKLKKMEENGAKKKIKRKENVLVKGLGQDLGWICDTWLNPKYVHQNISLFLSQ